MDKNPLFMRCLRAFALAGSFAAASSGSLMAEHSGPDVRAEVPTKLTTIAQDGQLRLVMHPPVVVMGNGGWQPYLFLSASGTLFCQAQLAAKPFNSKGKRVYPERIGTAISRDGGATWTRWTHQEGHDDVFIEGGAVPCSDGTILMLDTFIVPNGRADHGAGEVWRSHDDLRTLEGPTTADFFLPTVTYTGSTEDNGDPYAYARAHRSIIEMPNGDLITTVYGHFLSDTAPSAYLPTMKKFRTTVVRSRDHGVSWSYLATVAADGGVGTEGFAEPVLVRLARGPHAGRLLCLNRTGRDLYGTHSDDDGKTWSEPAPVHFPGIDIHQRQNWQSLFATPEAPADFPLDDMIGSIVNPDLIQMQDGTLVCTVGVRAPQKKYSKNWRAPQNGDYLAFSRDGGDTWSNVVQFLSGQPTTQYMGVRELRPGLLYVVYDDSIWKLSGRTMGFQLEVSARSN